MRRWVISWAACEKSHEKSLIKQVISSNENGLRVAAIPIPRCLHLLLAVYRALGGNRRARGGKSRQRRGEVIEREDFPRAKMHSGDARARAAAMYLG